ncbi:MAG: S1 RNA-binding domain-containing protein [Clostridia bacterium]|nr:S1 RNA-binding domain-containing protein [Clostridia bacterium]
MKEISYLREGIKNPGDEVYLSSLRGLKNAMRQGRILQARCIMCDAEHNLYVDLGERKGIIPREEAALGIREGTVRDVAIITRVNKMVSFKVIDAEEDRVILSRAAAQRECREALFATLTPGDVLPARITHLEPFGAFADIGCGIISMISIDNISVSRIRHPADRFSVGMEIMAVVREVDTEQGRITLSHKELLGTWKENADRFEAGQTVSGIVRSVENYGIFVELAPNLAGLAEYAEGIRPGTLAGVYIKSILPDKMKIKLAIVDTGETAPPPEEPEYFISEGHLRHWRYSPADCPRVIETDFEEQKVILHCE